MPTTYYQEMYKYLEERKIQFKLYSGKSWEWYESKLSKWNIQKNTTLLSPSTTVYENFVIIGIPIKITFYTLESIEEKMKHDDLKICGVVFSGGSDVATCVAVDKDGRFIKSKFIRGGDTYKYITSQSMRKIKKNNHKTKNIGRN